MIFLRTSILLLLVLIPGGLFAQERLALTLTPPLFRLTLAPGESWPSSVKLVNVNDYDLTVYAQTMDFTDREGRGTPEFFPASDDPNNTHSLGSWITVSDGPIVIPRGSTKYIPFSIHIPEGAEPGGHYGAIQVGTLPVSQKGESGVAVGSQVATLFFVRVSGPVTEEALIRDFYTASILSGSADQTFILSVENTGNVHIQPQGEINIKNMWGKFRGKVDINKESNFGNVLPNSSRRFEFKWDGEENLFDIGRYSAEVAISYGEDGKQSLFRKTHFWVIPWGPVSKLLGGFVILIGLVIWSIRRYIRQALDLERRNSGLQSLDRVAPSMRVIRAPIQKSVQDFGRIGEQRAYAQGKRPIGIGEYFWRYRFIFFGLLLSLTLGYSVFIYFSSVLTSTRDFRTEVVKPDQQNTVVSQ